MQVTSHVNVCHDDGPAAQHDVRLAFNFGLARDFVAGILDAEFSQILTIDCSSNAGCKWKSLQGGKRIRL